MQIAAEDKILEIQFDLRPRKKSQIKLNLIDLAFFSHLLLS
jgi:hypothetical protein